MNKLYQKIQQGLQCLPPKDAELCSQFLKNRELEKLLEIVESCLIMKKRDDCKETHKDKWLKVNKEQLEQLVLDVRAYNYYSNPYDLDTCYQLIKNL